MSMNLHFEVSCDCGCVTCEKGDLDFPFQTPTDLSYAVMQAEGTPTRLLLIQEELRSWGWVEADFS